MTSKALPSLAALAVAALAIVGIVVPWTSRAPAPTALPLAPPPFVELPPPPTETPPALSAEESAPRRTRAVERDIERRLEPRAFAEESVWTLDVLVLDPDDQPLPGARVLLAPVELPWNTVGWTDARGRVSIELAAPLDSQRVVVASEHERYGRSTMRVVELSPRPWHLAIELRPSPDAPRFAVEEAGALFEPRGTPAWAASAIDAHLGGERAPELALLDPAGRTRFVQRIDGLPGEPLETPSGWSTPTPPPSPTRELDPGESAVFVKGIVRDAFGARVGGARVHAFDAERGLDFSLRAFHDGSFGLGPIPASGMHLSIGGGDLGRHESDLSGSPERFQHVNAALQRGRELGGVLRDESGLALAGWRVEAADSSGTHAWADVTWSDSRGRFALPNAPSTMVRIDVFAPDAPALPAWSERGLWAEPDLAIAVPAHAREHGSVRAELVDAAGVALADAELVLESESASRATVLAFDPLEGAFVARALPPGRYRWSAHHRGDRSIASTSALEVRAGARTDLGRVAFERRGMLAVDADPALGAIEYALERRHGAWTVHLGAFRARGRWVARLAPGFHVVRARFAGGEERSFELDVDARHARVLRVETESAR